LNGHCSPQAFTILIQIAENKYSQVSQSIEPLQNEEISTLNEKKKIDKVFYYPNEFISI
jgi:hypothetical protein